MTLIEMLVSLLILSACMALVSGVTFQVAKLLSTMQTSDSTALQRFMMTHQTIDSALQRASVGALTQSGSFVASSRRINLRTTASPSGVEHAESDLSLIVRDQGGEGSIVLLADDLGDAVLMRGKHDLSFSFIDDQMVEHSRWPATDDRGGAKVPRMVRVIERDVGVVAIWVLHGPRLAHPNARGGPGGFAGGSPL